MVNVTIDNLLNGTALRDFTSKIMFNQGGISYNDIDRPNPTNQINIKNQAQLEAQINSDIEITDGDIAHLSIDESMTLTKPIKLGSLSGLDLVLRVGVTINYTGPGKMIQLTTPGVPALFVYTENLDVLGDNTNSLIDIEIVSFGFVTMIGFSLADLASIGKIDSPSVLISRPTGFGVTQGLVLVNPTQAFIDTKVMGNFSATNTTWISIITDVVSHVELRGLNASNTTTGDSLVFFDPNAPAGSVFGIAGSRILVNTTPGVFYQQGTDITINSVTNIGSGKIRFTTAVSHNLVVGKAFVANGFTTETTYNKTYITIAVDTPLTGTTVDVEEVFTDDDTGNMNTTSLNQKDILVRAKGNINSPDSKIVGSGFVNGNAVVTTIASSDTPQDLNFGTLMGSINIERFTLMDAANGEFRYDGAEITPIPITMSITLRKTGGSTQNYIITWIKDDGGGYASLDDDIKLPFEAKTSNIGGTYIGESGLVTGDLLKPQIEGIGTSDDIIVDSVSIRMKN